MNKLLAVLLIGLTWSGQLHAQWLRDTRELMGTRVSVELWSEDALAGRRGIDAVMEEVQRLDVMMNPWNPASELARINREAARAPVVTTPEIMEVLERALYYSRLSNGAFDISFASVGQYYDYRAGTAPNDERVARYRGNIDFRSIVLDVAARSVGFARPGLQIDLGGIAKGYAVDRGIDILQRQGIVAAVITAGGDSRILGDLGDRPRTIGIRHPRREGEYVAMIPLADTAISTSGDYERFFMQDGVRFHHILDPGTGRSAQGVQSATIVAPRAIDTDALSTTAFVLGVQRGLELINSLPGVDAIIIDGQGKLHYSADLLLSTTP
jgi:FAD:protein FMN transferase